MTIDVPAYLSDFKRLATIDWPDNRTLNVVCHGHSVPAGYFKTPDIQMQNAYPRLLHQFLNQNYPHAVINVIVTAIGGEHSEFGAARFDRDVLPLRPDVVTVDYGLNDRRLGPERARVAWTQMIRSCIERKIKIILLTPTPDLSSDLCDESDPLNQHANQIRMMAEEYQTGLADSLAIFRQAISAGVILKSLMSQINHPNAAGHELVLKGLSPWFVL